MEVSGQLHAPTVLSPEKTGTHWIGGWVGPGAGGEETKSLTGMETRIIQTDWPVGARPRGEIGKV